MTEFSSIRSALARHPAVILSTVLLALAIVPAAHAARHLSPMASKVDSATATGENLVTDDFSAQDIAVSAFSGPSGEDPGGSVSFNPGGILPISGPVTCLDVRANTAVMTVQGPFPSRPGFTAFIVRIVDNGGSGLDRFEYWPLLSEDLDPIDCHTGSSDYFGGVLIGRAVVSDSPTLPTSKKQCRHRGYKLFGFKSRRRCLRFVAHH